MFHVINTNFFNLEFRYNQESLSPEIGETKERDEIIVDCSDVNLLVKPGCEFNTPKVYEDESLQRNMELRESKISVLLRKQRGLLQSLEKKATNMMKSAWWFLMIIPGHWLNLF